MATPRDLNNASRVKLRLQQMVQEMINQRMTREDLLSRRDRFGAVQTRSFASSSGCARFGSTLAESRRGRTVCR